MVVVLWVLTMVTFFLTTIAPSDPAGLWVGPRPKPGQLEKARKQLGLDKPAHVRYVIYLKNLTRGDFGVSIRTRQPVTEELKRYFAATIELVTVAIIISLIIGIPLGIYTAFRRESLADHSGRIFSLMGVAVPIFWLGMIVMGVMGAWRVRSGIDRRARSSEEEVDYLWRYAGYALCAMLSFCGSGYFLSRAFVYPMFFLMAVLGAVPLVAQEYINANGTRTDVPVIFTEHPSTALTLCPVLAGFGMLYVYLSCLMLNLGL